jgi:MFS transporter, DHA3 family, macrolide efflux protein
MAANALNVTDKQGWAAPFFTIWIGQAFSLLGSMLVQFALVWWLTKTTGSATVLATATLAAVLPSVIFGPVAGALVDRWNRRAVMIGADLLIALATLVLIYFFRSGAVQVWYVYAAMAFRGAMGGLHWPAMQASTSLMVPEKHLTRVAALNQTLNGAMNIVAPPLGALLIVALPMQFVLVIDVVTALLAVTPLLFIAVPQPARCPAAGGAEVALTPGNSSGRPSIAQDLRAGWRYVLSWPGLLGVLVLAMAINFVTTPAFSLMPILVTKHFGGGALQLGWLESGWGMGVVVGGLVLSAWGGFRRRVVTSLTGIVGAGIGMLIVGFSPAWALVMAVAGMFLSGFMNPIINGPFFALLQSNVEADMQGRVLGLVQSAAAAMMPLSLLVAGPIADTLGVRVWYLLGGGATLVIGMVCFFVPAIMHIESNGRARETGDNDAPPVNVAVQGEQSPPAACPPAGPMLT